ncbi:hypothetical protein OBBRIDRAFT_730185 [Obba rivulosa]|uniref:Spherulin 4 n=1 Tax=Obba rivulosa TaxID=1052685 RepID=A0A8E2DL59_9APHY|nr:hypothetical protein OBBRIDRAFT_730185 [Obba rivulosa]
MYLPRTINAIASGIFLPLYVFPGDPGVCSSWTGVIDAIAEHPALPFYIVVNPDTGPGATGSQPSSSYQGCVPLLKASNVKLLGYVDTAEAGRASSAVEADISTYADWESAYSVDGIFFDDVSGASSDLSTYETWTAFAKESFGGGDGFVNALYLRTGLRHLIVSSYFGIADFIVTLENAFDDFSTSDITISTAEPASQQVVILNSGPSSVSASTVSELVGDDQLAAIYITSSADYTSVDSDFGDLATAVENDG